MKKILSLVLVSALGGVLTLGAYKLFLEKENKNVVVATADSNPTFLPTNNISGPLKAYETSDFTTAAENTVHAVVHVKNVTISSGQMTFEDLFFGRRQQRAQLGTGSGVIINADGYIITNNHVIKNAHELSVTLNNNKTYEAKLIGTDQKTDIALLKIDADEALPFVTFGDSDEAKIGEWVLAVGNPFNLTSTVTAGIISAKARDLSGNSSQSFIQTDAAVNPGNSGGALVNTNGELIGINTAITSQTGSYIGYSFAVPSNIARKVIEDIMEYGNVQNGVLGVSILNKASKEAIELGINEIEGVYVSEVIKNSGAEKAGIKKGDIIKKLDNIKISNFPELSGYIKTKRPNDIVNVELLRDNKLKSFSVSLTKTAIFSVNFMKMELQDLSDSFKEKYNIDYGVMVKNTKNQWLYSNLGISEGYIITGINDTKIETIEDISKLKEKYGDDILENIKKLEYINTRKEKKEVIFK
ncbi:trypsin-like peptidase domain-containing protein [Flavivirga sp. 57AJ16]|uniref:trypsin-like peptidase domain-containing protein n=1 Tax=Flavivirga sp. 57AJ16 TaxID=3025307 RepID=UPI0023671652|nr:trypsin-like peptidase domain-containing protein [Flavivirga sp. 57AJ16]MDD7887439.1 trypsin-like peptidase domain-containing protein [Flavivirga sp. 57AJ16]